ncbi:TPA: hypothetical protein DHU97_01710 [Candidatus Saccharibacteria bacterium]|nr:hypothetical protein [Candidatus Saccharibacteria bacterium]
MQKTRSGFTIVELIIVIIVISILANLTIITYNGLVQRTGLHYGDDRIVIVWP